VKPHEPSAEGLAAQPVAILGHERPVLQSFLPMIAVPGVQSIEQLEGGAPADHHFRAEVWCQRRVVQQVVFDTKCTLGLGIQKCHY